MSHQGDKLPADSPPAATGPGLVSLGALDIAVLRSLRDEHPRRLLQFGLFSKVCHLATDPKTIRKSVRLLESHGLVCWPAGRKGVNSGLALTAAGVRILNELPPPKSLTFPKKFPDAAGRAG